MNIAYSKFEMVHHIICGIPDLGAWGHFCQLMTQTMQDHIEWENRLSADKKVIPIPYLIKLSVASPLSVNILSSRTVFILVLDKVLVPSTQTSLWTTMQSGNMLTIPTVFSAQIAVNAVMIVITVIEMAEEWQVKDHAQRQQQ